MGIYLRKDSPHYWYSFKIPGHGRTMGSTGTNDKKLAKKIYDIKKAEALQVKHGMLKEKVSLESVFAYYLKEHAEHKFAQRLFRSVQKQFTRILHKFNYPDANDFGPDQIRVWENLRRSEGLSHPSIDREMMYIRAAYNMRIDSGVDLRVPTRAYEFTGLVERRNRSLKVIRIMDDTEIELFLSYCPRDLAEYLIFFYASAMRPIEVMSVKKSDLDLEGGRVRTNRSKGGQDTLIPLPAKVVTMLARRVANLPPDGYVFGGPNGEKKTWSLYRRSFEAARDEFKTKEKRPHFRPYDLRHSLSDYLLRQWDLKTASVIMGHASTAMMDQVYSHISEAKRRVAAEILPAKVFSRLDDKCYASATLTDSIDGKTTP